MPSPLVFVAACVVQPVSASFTCGAASFSELQSIGHGVRKDDLWVSLLSEAKRDGSYVSGFVEGQGALERLLKVFYDCTHSSFAVRQSAGEWSRKDAQSILGGLLGKEVLWQHQVGDIKIPSDGTPFVVCGRTALLECQQGPPKRRSSSTGTQSKRVGKSVQCSRKGDCRAVLKHVRVLRFPEHAIDLASSTSEWRMRKNKESARREILWAVRSEPSTLHVAERHYVLLPTKSAHNGHLSSVLGEAAARRSQRVHPEQQDPRVCFSWHSRRLGNSDVAEDGGEGRYAMF